MKHSPTCYFVHFPKTNFPDIFIKPSGFIPYSLKFYLTNIVHTISVPGLGFEPRLMDSESIFLPLEDPGISNILKQKTSFFNPVLKFKIENLNLYAEIPPDRYQA